MPRRHSAAFPRTIDSTSPRAWTSTSISVAVDPGEIVLTVIQCGASSSAMQRAAWMIAAFEAEYAVLFSRTTLRPTIDAKRTIRPATPSATKCRAQAWARNTVPRAFTPSVRSHCSGVSSRKDAGARTPAALTRMSSRPCCRTTSATRLPACSTSARSAGCADAAGPEALDRCFELAARQIDAGDPRAGGDERLGAGEADAPLRAGDKRDAAVEPPRSGSRLRSAAHRSATIASTSTGMSNGRCGTPTDVRAARRLASVEVDDQVGEAVDHGRMLGEAVDRVDVAVDLEPARDLSRPPSSRSIVPSTLSAVSSAAATASADRHLAPDLAERAAPALAVRRPVARDVGDVPEAHEPAVRQPHARRDHLRAAGSSGPARRGARRHGTARRRVREGWASCGTESIACPLEPGGSPPPAMASSPVVV